jgi:hypothetical protein
MKDEEMAEQYVKENGKVYYHPNGVPIFTREEDMKFAFLAGLKAGRPQWHKVADGNLPKDDENFMCILENGYRIECYYDPTTKKWYDNFFHHDIEYGYYQSKVIAWCEIPTFDKE